jgi:hypothetical protein
MVKQGQWHQSTVALKQLKTTNLQGLLREVKIAKALQHPNIIQFFGVVLNTEAPWMVFFRFIFEY